MPYEGKTGPDTGQSFSAQLSNLEHRFTRALEHVNHVNMVLTVERDRAHSRLREMAASDSPEEFDAESHRQEESDARVAKARASVNVGRVR